MKNKQILILTTLTVLFISCTGDFLEIKPKGQTFFESLTNKQGVNLLLTGAYADIDGVNGTVGDGWSSGVTNWVWGGVASDDATKGSNAGDQNAINAVEAALDMVDELMAFRSELGEAGSHFDVGIGLHSGPAVVGLIGSSQRLDYTAIGDTVNLASRIEGQTKGVARILVSQATRELCGDQFEFIDHGVHHVKGREQGVRLFEPKRRAI